MNNETQGNPGMKKRFKDFLCRLGIHAWDYTYVKVGYLQEYHRDCQHCGKSDAANAGLSAPAWIKRRKAFDPDFIRSKKEK